MVSTLPTTAPHINGLIFCGIEVIEILLLSQRATTRHLRRNQVRRPISATAHAPVRSTNSRLCWASGHREVAQQDVGTFALQDVQGLFGGVDRGDVGAIALQHVRHDIEDIACVVDDQNPHTGEPRTMTHGGPSNVGDVNRAGERPLLDVGPTAAQKRRVRAWPEAAARRAFWRTAFGSRPCSRICLPGSSMSTLAVWMRRSKTACTKWWPSSEWTAAISTSTSMVGRVCGSRGPNRASPCSRRSSPPSSFRGRPTRSVAAALCAFRGPRPCPRRGGGPREL